MTNEKEKEYRTDESKSSNDFYKLLKTLDANQILLLQKYLNSESKRIQSLLKLRGDEKNKLGLGK